MRIDAVDNTCFGMKKIAHIRQVSGFKPVDPNFISNVNETIRKALRGTKPERFRARQSAKKVVLSK